MLKTTHLQKVLLVIVVTLFFSIGSEEWWGPVLIAAYIYYFSFVVNLFNPIYNRENILTRAFFRVLAMPLYVAIGIIVMSIFVRKLNPEMQLDSFYINAVIGGVATTFARFRQGKLKKAGV